MTYKKSFSRVLAALLALTLLAGCGAAAGPAVQTEAPAPVQEAQPTEAPVSAEPSPEAEPAAAEGGEVHVSNVDELLDAIAPNTVIVLAPGDYDFSAAANYGVKPEGARYDWDKLSDSDEKGEQYELIISFVDKLTIRGEDRENTRILIQPRFANVILFDVCRDLSVENLTVGHTDGGVCSGGVLRFDRCKNVRVDNCGLFGCGTVGVDGRNCDGLSVTGSRIYECSDAALTVQRCSQVRVEDCEIYRHGASDAFSTATSLFLAANTDGFVIFNNRIYDNDAQYLLNCSYTRNAFFLSNEVHDNVFGAGAFSFRQYPCVVDGCVFANNVQPFWVTDHALDPISPEGKPLDAGMLEAMTLHDCDPDMPFPTVALATAAEVEPGGTIKVATIDEFLAAIGPDRTILLEGELFDLSAAESYGKSGTEYYSWQECWDGPELLIQNVSNLSIIAPLGDAPAVVISAAPRYADVLNFKNCSGLVLEGFTAGHTKEPGTCAGGVLYFDGCSDVQIERCRLYGCGILGLQAVNCGELRLNRTEIYECSDGGGQFYNTDSVVFHDCDIHDVPTPHLQFSGCGYIEWNDEPLNGSQFDVGKDGWLVGLNG